MGTVIIEGWQTDEDLRGEPPATPTGPMVKRADNGQGEVTADKEQITLAGEVVEGSGSALVSVEGRSPMKLFVYSSEQVVALTAPAAPPARRPARGKPRSKR